MTRISAFVASTLLALAAAQAHATPVDVELVLAVDVSESMDGQEFAIQRAGYVEALRDRPSSGPRGRDRMGVWR